jgi:flagellar motor switch protein FliG
MTKATDATMRRIAIVLASLPEPVAQRLLGSLPRENQRLVRTALGTLSDVDPLEQRRALDGFAHSLRKDKTTSQRTSDAAEIVFSRTAIRNLNEQADERRSNDSSQRHSNQDEANSATPLGFLLDVDDETLVAHLKGELPQTLAIILASISPSQAARVLPRLDTAVRADAMRRIANLKELPADLVDDIGKQLRDRFSSYGNNGTGRRALEAILAEMPQASSMQSAAAPTPSSVNSSAPITSTNASTFSSRGSESTRNEVALSSSSPVGESMGNPSSSRLKVADGTWPVAPGTDETASVQLSASRMDSQNSSTLRMATPLDSTDATHEYLLSLPIDRLREALGRSETRQALLTLCGLPTSKAEALLASLPRRQAKQVREQLASMGTLQLRDIDEAKAAIAKIAYQSSRDDRGSMGNESKSFTVSHQSSPSMTAAAA